MKRLATMLGALLLVTTACRGSGASSEASDGFYGDTAITAEEETPAGPIQFQTLTANYLSKVGSLTVFAEVSLEAPKGDSSTAREFSKCIVDCINAPRWEGEEKEIVLNSLSESSVQRFANDYYLWHKKICDNNEYLQNIEGRFGTSISGKCCLATEKVVCYRIVKLDYDTESAPYPETSNILFDVARHKQLKWDNMAAQANRAQINALLLSTMIAQSSSFKDGDGYYRTVASTGDRIGFWEGIDGICSEPYFTEKGVCFDFLGPADWYEDGFVIPYAKLRGLVKPEIEALFPAN